MAMLNSPEKHPFSPLLMVGIIAMVTWPLSGSAQSEAALPTQPSAEQGYFPTQAEDTLLRGPSDSRSLGVGFGPGVVEGPDTRALVATDLFRYYDSEPDFYQRNQDFFRPINVGLGLFTPHDAATIESRRLHFLTLSADAQFNVFTREFKPELAHVKAGPFYLDFLHVGAGVIYSDFNGDQTILQGDSNDDGWAAYVELGIRALVRITDSIYFSAAGNLIYLPMENELAFQMGNASNPGLLLRFNLMDTVGEWDILFFNEFIGRSGLDVFVDADSPAIDFAGRYSFGFIGDRSNNFYDRNQAFFTNTIGFYASRALFGQEWRLGFGIEHADSWRTFQFRDHGTREWLGLWMQYEGSVLPFAPRFGYEYFSNDGFESMIHQFDLQLTGRLTENLNWYGQAGYAFSTGDVQESNNFIWSFELDHTLSRSTRHFLTMGEGYIYNEFETDTRTARYIRYSVDQRFTSRFTARAYAQFVENEASARERFPIRDRFGAGLMLYYRPLDFTDIRGMAYFEQTDQSTTADSASRWIYRIEMNQQLSHRLTGNVFYQYEESNTDVMPFTEHFMGVSMRRYF